MRLKINLFTLIILLIMPCLFCSKKKLNTVSENGIVIKVDKEKNVFLGVDAFSGNYIYKPVRIKKNPITNELLILDRNNNCIYFFDEEGKYIRKVGNPGQGPGDLLRPINMDVDKDGDIYVVESGNIRISVFDKNGKFKKMIKYIYPFREQYEAFFSITNEKSLIFNIPREGYYITMLKQDGETKGIGDINNDKKYSNKASIDKKYRFAEGYPLINKQNNIVLIFSHLAYVRMYDFNGNLLFDKFLDNVVNIHNYNNIFSNNYDVKSGFSYFFSDFIIVNNNYYLLKLFDIMENKTIRIELVKLNDKFEQLNVYILLFDKDFKFDPSLYPSIYIPDDEKEVYLADPGGSLIYKIPLK